MSARRRAGAAGVLAALAPAAAGGALYALAYVGWGVWPLLAVFLVPLWCALERTRTAGLPASLAAGFVFGATAYAAGFGWLWRLVDVFLDGRILAGAAFWLGYGAWFALGFAAVAGLHHGARGAGWPVALAGVPALVATEWLQPQIFPVHAGSGLIAVPVLAQAADLGGPLLLTILVGVANAAAFATWRWLRAGGRRAGAPLAAWALAALALAAAFAYGRAREAQVRAAAARAPALEVGVVQANLGLLEKRTQAAVGHRRHLEQSRELLAAGPVDLLVWPETAYVRGVRRPLPVSGELIRGDLGVPLLFGAPSVEQHGGRRRRTNSALLVGDDGSIRDAYDKNLLIPLAEYVPLAGVVPRLAALLPHAQEFRAGEAAAPLHLGPWRIATPICYEVVRPDFVRRMMREGRPHLIVSLANDAWFGDSQEPWMHLALARLRAVEQRRYLVRATNSGVSAVVDATGRVTARTDLLSRANLRAGVRLLEGRTAYQRLGDWPGLLAAVLLAAALGTGIRPRGAPQAAGGGTTWTSRWG